MNKWGALAAAAVIAGPVGLLGVGMLGMSVALSGGGSAAATTAAASTCLASATPGVAVAGLDSEQAEVAGVFIAEGMRRGLPARAFTAAIAAGLVESGLRRLPYGDGSSVGPLQLIAVHGTVEQRTDALFSVSWFYNGLVRVPGWDALPVGVATQRVQRSAFPLRYGEKEAQATAIIAGLAGIDAGTCAPLATGPWTLPVALGGFRLSSPFGPRSSPGGIGSTNHQGLDFAAPFGMPIYAATEGVVVIAGPTGGYGNLVRVRHADGVETLYAHQSRLAVAANAPVAAGTLLGYVGSTGNSTGNHLHFEVRVNDRPTDPAPWLESRGVALSAVA